jgi:uncharacterized protein (TIGR00725 family)
MPTQVAVCGPARCSTQEQAYAQVVGELLARRGAVVMCGGGTGVMAGVAAGARAHGGLVIGVRPDTDRPPSSDLSAVVSTNMGEARNAVIVASADVVIAIGGSWGTLSEVALAMRRGVPVVSLGGWQILDRDGSPVGAITAAEGPADAVEAALAAVPVGRS